MQTPTVTFTGFLAAIYDFFVYIKNVVLTGSFHVSSGSTNYAAIFGGIRSWIVTIMTFLFILFVIWAIYIRIRVYEVDELLDGLDKKHHIPPHVVARKVNTRWATIMLHFASQNPNDWRAAIIDADSMLDELVTSLGYTGQSLGEKLTSIRINDFPTLQSAWEAHKVRNLIAHEGANYNLTERQKDMTRRNYEAVFRDAGII